MIGLFAGMAVLCWLLTCSFLESRNILVSAAGRTRPPETAESLEPYLDLATRIRRRNTGWQLPRFGMNEAKRLEEELGRRYTERYFDLKTIPGVERVQDDALAAGRSHDPAVIGGALLHLALIRDGISRTAAPSRRDGEGGRLLRVIADSLRLTTPEEMRQLDAYLAWAGGQDWMPDTRAALADFEKHVLDNANGGDLSWFPDWIASLPGLETVDTSCVWSAGHPSGPAANAIISPAWTRDGYLIARLFFNTLQYGRDNEKPWREKRDGILARYRNAALDRWQEAAAEVWSGFRDRIADGDLKRLGREISRREDPASRFIALAREHLLPMYEGEPDEPEIRWLRLQERLSQSPQRNDDGPGEGLGAFAVRLVGAVQSFASDRDSPARPDFGLAPGDPHAEAERHWRSFTAALEQAALLCESPAANLASVREHFRVWDGDVPITAASNPYTVAGEAASSLHSYLRETSGCASWDGLSPLAIVDYFRYLATRQAALSVDAAWRDKTYASTRLIAGSERDRAEWLFAKGGLLEDFPRRSGRFLALARGKAGERTVGSSGIHAGSRVPRSMQPGRVARIRSAAAHCRSDAAGRIGERAA